MEHSDWKQMWVLDGNRKFIWSNLAWEQPYTGSTALLQRLEALPSFLRNLAMDDWHPNERA